MSSSGSMNVDDPDEQQLQKSDTPQQQSTFETPEFMTEWTDTQKSEFAFQLLTSLPPNEVIQIVDRISPYLHRNILSQLPYEIAIEILGFLDVSSLIQASQVSRGWHALCEEQSLWRNLFEQQGWGYDREEMDIYISNIPDEEDYHAHSSGGSSGGGGSSSNMAPLPIVRTSSPLIGKSKWSRLYTMKNRPVADTKSIRKIKRFTLESLSSGGSNSRNNSINPHYDPVSDTRYINWQALYQNRLKIERRWKNGSCKVRMFPPANCPVSDLHTEGIYCIQFDKEKMVTGSRDRTIKIWDIQTGRCKMTLRGHAGSVLCLQYDAQDVVSGSSDTNLIVTDMETGLVKRTLAGHGDSVLSLRLVNKDQIISCSKDRTLRLWNKHTGEFIRQFNGHRAAVNAVQWHDNRVVSASGDRTIKIWDLNTGACLKTLESHTRGVACVEFDGTFIVSGSSDQTIKVWDATSGECVYTLVGHTELVRTIQLDPVAKRIISGCYNGHLKIWSLDEGRALRDLGQATEGRILNLKFDFTKIACCSNLVKIVIYDFADGIDTKFLL
ncbi:WD40 repeat-like protein [Mucor ambiguus]|uniref:WD40 repeat-like protein n=1 Tax=Mucor ambiguus TaxID=91626 RepID=A0A0C9MFK9_9FUNG|nr:WD40 repeat-like protein [Mucor ambiguus]